MYMLWRCFFIFDYLYEIIYIFYVFYNKRKFKKSLVSWRCLFYFYDNEK